jgi:hypothetical protein
MSLQDLFDIVAVGSIALPCSVAGVAVLLSWPDRLPLKVMGAIFAGWGVAVVFTMFVYNPAGIAAGVAAGVDSPETRFDNNTIAVAILGGWVFPAMAVSVFLGVRALIRKIRSSPRRA